MSARNVRQATVIFGAGGAIGMAILERLRQRGADTLVATYHDTLPSSPHPRRVWFDAGDDTGAEHGTGELRAMVSEFDAGVEAVFYCIGIPSTKQLITETTAGEWASLFLVNCVGFIRGYAAIRDACRAGRARVIVLSSDATRTLRETNGPYTASKTALEAVCVTLAREEASYGVRINVLAPSLVDSPLGDHVLTLSGISNKMTHAQMLPWGRFLSVEEVADAAISLALDDCWAYTTGQIFRLAAGI